MQLTKTSSVASTSESCLSSAKRVLFLQIHGEQIYKTLQKASKKVVLQMIAHDLATW